MGFTARGSAAGGCVEGCSVGTIIRVCLGGVLFARSIDSNSCLSSGVAGAHPGGHSAGGGSGYWSGNVPDTCRGSASDGGSCRGGKCGAVLFCGAGRFAEVDWSPINGNVIGIGDRTVGFGGVNRSVVYDAVTGNHGRAARFDTFTLSTANSSVVDDVNRAARFDVFNRPAVDVHGRRTSSRVDAFNSSGVRSDGASGVIRPDCFDASHWYGVRGNAAIFFNGAARFDAFNCSTVDTNGSRTARLDASNSAALIGNVDGNVDNTACFDAST